MIKLSATPIMFRMISGNGEDLPEPKFADSPIPNRGAISYYLKHGGNSMLTSCSFFTDCFTGERVASYAELMDDGTYCWWSSLAYYVEQYNLVLPDDFLDHINEQTEVLKKRKREELLGKRSSRDSGKSQ